MRITIFNGSPRMERGNTCRMTAAFTEGAVAAGAEVQQVLLAKKTIRPCLGCFGCWTKRPGECMQQDDMRELLPLVAASDLVIFATPLYVDNVTGIMKVFMDRLIPLVSPYFEQDPEGEYRHQRRLEKIPRLGVIANCGLPEQSQFQVLRLLLPRVARNLQSELVVEIYRAEGELLGSKSLVLRPFLNRYWKLLRRAGEEVARDGRLSEQTQHALEKPLVPPHLYMRGANKYWDRMLAQREEA